MSKQYFLNVGMINSKDREQISFHLLIARLEFLQLKNVHFDKNPQQIEINRLRFAHSNPQLISHTQSPIADRKYNIGHHTEMTNDTIFFQHIQTQSMQHLNINIDKQLNIFLFQ